jgi:hypothetical protein
MKKFIWLSATFLATSAILLTGCGNTPKTVINEPVEPTEAQLIQKGEYLVTIMGCNDCHSPKTMGPQGPVVIADLMLSGYPAERPVKKVDSGPIKKGWVMLNEDFTSAAGQWGVSFAGNLTSDQTGIGNWTEENFRRALKEGKYKGLEVSRMLLPPMPWTNFATIKDEDVKAIFLYLKSTKPVSNVVPMAIGPDQIL